MNDDDNLLGEAHGARRAATFVTRRWPADPGAPGGKLNRVGFEYDANVPAEIAEWDPHLPASFAADVARVELGVRELHRHRPALGALLWPLLRTEAIASSRIEGLIVSHHRLAVAQAIDGPEDSLARSVLGNLDALRHALERADEPITPQTICEIHRALLANTAQAAIAGRIRETQNWIGGRHPNPRGAAFVPPPEHELERLLSDLCRFCERDDLPILVHAAIAHVQFETIHPFADGNGRVGRALVQAILRRRGLTQGRDGGPAIFPPVSLVLAANSEAYVAGLTRFRSGAHLAWLEFFLHAVHSASTIADDLADSVTRLQAKWRVDAAEPRIDSAASKLISGLPAAPVIDLAQAVGLTGASTEAARRAINRLEAAGVLRELTGRGRLRRWASVGLFELVDTIEITAVTGARRSISTSPPMIETV
jgi:Fic family protein